MAQAAAPTKHLLASKTFWWNLASIVYYVLGQLHALPALDTETQGLITAAVNIGLRMVTTQPVHLS